VHAADRDALAEMLGLVFPYDSREILGRVESHAGFVALWGTGCFAAACAALLEDSALSSDRFKEIITSLKENLDMRGRNCFIPFVGAGGPGWWGETGSRNFAFG